MREILFRGKTITTKKWIFSRDILRSQDWINDQWIKNYYLKDGYACNQNSKIDEFEKVFPESFSLYTQFTDKEDIDIFKGDILISESELYSRFGTVPTGKFDETFREIIWKEDSWGTKVLKSKTIVEGSESKGLKIHSKYGKVIGNKFDIFNLKKNKYDL